MNIRSAFQLSTIGFATLIVLSTFSKHVVPKVQAHEVSEGCTLASLKGDYGSVLKGEVLGGGGPIVSVGVSTFDGKGHFVADQTINQNGNVFQEAGTGTYTVNRNCSGIADVAGLGPHSFVIVAGGKEIELMNNNTFEVLTIHFTKIWSATNDHHED